ncbi:hypothetical protein [Sphingomonas oryzagri]
MGKTNLLYGLENKLGHLLGELDAKRDEVMRIKALVDTLPAITARIRELEQTIEGAETVIKFDHPDWERDTIDPVRPQVHQIPVKLGEATRKALEVLRDAGGEGMTFRDVARAVLRREGVEYDQKTLDKVSNTIGNSLRKKTDILESDGGWPAKWRVIRRS